MRQPEAVWLPALEQVLLRHRERVWIAGSAILALLLGYPLAHRPWMVTGLVAGAVLLALSLLRPLTIVGLMLLLGAVDLSMLTGGFKSMFAGVGGLDMNGIRLIGLVFSFTAIALVDREVVRHAFGGAGRWYLVFLVFAAFTLLYTPARVDGARLLFKLAYPFLTFIVVSGVARTPEALERLARWALAGAVGVVLLNPVAVMAGRYSVYDGHVRLYGIGQGHNIVSFYLLIMLLVALGRYSARGQARYLALAGVLGVWMALTLTRVTVGAAVVGLSGMALYEAIVARRFRGLAAAALVGAAIAVPLTPVLLERSLGFVPTAGEVAALVREPGRLYHMINWQGRQVVWPVVFQAFLSNPVFGLGLGASTAVMLGAFSTSMGGVVHNDYLRLATDTGVVGVSLFAAAIVSWCAALVRVGRSAEPAVREYASPAFAGILAWSIIAITDNPFDYYASYTQYIGFLCAGALAAHRFAAAAGPTRSGEPLTT